MSRFQAEDISTEKCDVTVQTIVVSHRSREVSTQTDGGMTTSKGQVNISDLQQAQLKDVLQYLDYPQLFRVRQGKLCVISQCRSE